MLQSPKHRPQGFILVKLIVIIAIIGILAAIAIIAYQNYTGKTPVPDTEKHYNTEHTTSSAHVGRSHVSEALALTPEQKAAMAEYYTTDEKHPASVIATPSETSDR